MLIGCVPKSNRLTFHCSDVDGFSEYFSNLKAYYEKCVLPNNKVTLHSNWDIEANMDGAISVKIPEGFTGSFPDGAVLVLRFDKKIIFAYTIKPSGDIGSPICGSPSLITTETYEGIEISGLNPALGFSDIALRLAYRLSKYNPDKIKFTPSPKDNKWIETLTNNPDEAPGHDTSSSAICEMFFGVYGDYATFYLGRLSSLYFNSAWEEIKETNGVESGSTTYPSFPPTIEIYNPSVHYPVAISYKKYKGMTEEVAKSLFDDYYYSLDLESAPCYYQGVANTKCFYPDIHFGTDTDGCIFFERYEPELMLIEADASNCEDPEFPYWDGSNCYACNVVPKKDSEINTSKLTYPPIEGCEQCGKVGVSQEDPTENTELENQGSQISGSKPGGNTPQDQGGSPCTPQYYSERSKQEIRQLYNTLDFSTYTLNYYRIYEQRYSFRCANKQSQCEYDGCPAIPCWTLNGGCPENESECSDTCYCEEDGTPPKITYLRTEVERINK